MIPEFKRDDVNDNLLILKALTEIPFSVGKNLLIDFLKGNLKNKSIINNKLDELSTFDCLEDYAKDDVKEMVEDMINKKFIEITSTDSNYFMKVLVLSEKGKKGIKKS